MYAGADRRARAGRGAVRACRSIPTRSACSARSRGSTARATRLAAIEGIGARHDGAAGAAAASRRAARSRMRRAAAAEPPPLGRRRRAATVSRCWQRAAGAASCMSVTAPLLAVEGLVEAFRRRGARCFGRPLGDRQGGRRRRASTLRRRRDPGAGRRIRLRQVHARPPGAAADRADRRHACASTARHRRARRARAARAPARMPDHLPGPLRVAQPAHDGGRHPRRAAGAARHRAAGRAPRRASPSCCASVGLDAAARARATRTSSPAASASASASRARSRSSRS